ncbi:transcriptional regulator [Mycobacterium spongiae]|uniref:Transcriptional regulator n=2 Tax=Mycobacterium spongiae TaxID=886343 RepID=A0A975K1J9_9MYCO|nr:transcriptional regulator [Mycobacterium spongiae]
MPVSRDQAADAVGIAHHQAKFHLDRLTAEGLLDTDYARLSGRSGPGAGRTSKLYRRSDQEISVSLPQREYELAGRLMAAAIARSASTGEPVVELLNRAANDYGRAIAAAAAGRPPADPADALAAALRVLRNHGYEPRTSDGSADYEVELVNCPFHALAREQTELACNMNHALITGVAEALAPHGPDAWLEPGSTRCCVVLKRCAAPSPTR